jgi:hypothetical protein
MKPRAKTRSKTPVRANARSGRKSHGQSMEKDDVEKLHERINGLSARVVDLEAQRPHINSALDRIEKSVDRLNAHLVRAVWIILGLFIVALWRIVSPGGAPGF